MIDHTTIERIRAAADIVDVVQEFVTLRKSGANYIGLCPFHDDRTPSFTVSPTRQTCKCWSCGEGGNVFSFVMKHEQLSFPEAIKWLGKRYGIEVKERELTEKDKAIASERESLLVVNEWAQQYFQKTLHESADGIAIGMAYFRGRALRDDTIRKFGLGYAPETSNALLTAAEAVGHKTEYLCQTGLCKQSEDGGRTYDAFRGRVMFPIYDTSGRVVGFGGRILASEKVKNVGKYINSPESAIYHKERVLYGLYQAKKAIAAQDEVIIVEGYLDVISMHQCGIENVVAPCGTAFTEGQINLIRRFTNNATLIFDGDAAGIHAAERATRMLLANGFKIKVLVLPDGQDPDEFAKTHSATEFKQYIEANATDFIRFFTTLRLKESKGDPQMVIAAIDEMATYIALIPDTIARQVYTKECAELTGISEQNIIAAVDKERHRIVSNASSQSSATRSNVAANADSRVATQPQGAPTAPSALPAPAADNIEERELAIAVLRYGDMMLYPTPEDGKKPMVTEEENTKVATFVVEELTSDGITLTNALYRAVIEEAAVHAEEADFVACNYFLEHQDTAIAQFATQTFTDKYPLCQSQQKQFRQDEMRLYEIVPRLVLDVKCAVVKKEIARLQLQIRDPEVQKDAEAVNRIMEELMVLRTIMKKFAPLLGDRVVTR